MTDNILLLPTLPNGYLLDTEAESLRIFTPYSDPQIAIESFLSFALQKDSIMRTIIYGCTLNIFFDTFIKAKQIGCDIKIIFDHTQADGKAEKQQIEKLIQSGLVDGKDFVIGTSPKHNIVHLKQTSIGYGNPRKYLTLEGSWNYSKSATEEMNMLSFTASPRLAEYTFQVFDNLWNWILQHEESYQQVK
ncbi:MAG: phospholipase D-like domain-containing protein [Conexivisphaerales archaeon]